jgi:hypothetical protein
VSLIGTLEQLNLLQVLQRLEAYEKSGLLVVKHKEKWVEFYFQQGRLMCLGPVNTGLGDRLLQAGIISPQALQESMATIGSMPPNETRIALTLMDLGHVSEASLRAWATKEAIENLQLALTWSTGEIYFEDGLRPSNDRLLIAVPVASLLSSLRPRMSQPVYTGATSTATQELFVSIVPAPDASGGPVLLSASELVSESSFIAPVTSSLSSSQPYQILGDSGSPNTTSSWLSQPRPVSRPMPPQRIDTSFMMPEMLLMPSDLSSLRDQNPHVQLTPEQWRLFTLVDGSTSLKMACQTLGATPELVCLLAGELMALGLVQVLLPSSAPANELSPISRDLAASSLSNGYLVPGYAASIPQPWAVMPTPTTETLRPFSPSTSIATRSQWGNGESPMMFVPGHGWVHKSQPLQTLAQNDPPRAINGVYMQVGGTR